MVTFTSFCSSIQPAERASGGGLDPVKRVVEGAIAMEGTLRRRTCGGRKRKYMVLEHGEVAVVADALRSSGTRP